MGAMNLIGKAKTEVEDSEDDMICVSKKGKPYNQLEMHKLGGGKKGKGGGNSFLSYKNYTHIKIIQWEQHEQIMHFQIRRVLKAYGY
jgi:hypothetical protein